jgi:diguanylate cyclase (GGDEF)-like protein
MAAELTAFLLLAAAFALSLAFHRHRAAQFCLLLALMLGGLLSTEPRDQLAALRFAPLFLLACAAMAEPRLLSRRHAILLALILLVVGPVMLAPDRLFRSLAATAAFPLSGQAPRTSAFVFVFVAAMVCLGRWVHRGQPIDLGLAIALLPAAAAAGRGTASPWLFAASAALVIVAILYASYRMAFIDTLSGLPNRRALDETLSRLSGNYVLAMIDIDHFKGFNDTYGHDAGDIVLRGVAGGLKAKAGGEVYRYGGEEFSVVYPGATPHEAARGLEAARQHIERLTIAVPAPRKRRSEQGAPALKEVSVTVSAGCAARSNERRSVGEVLKAADQALYKAKEKGRNRVVQA